MEEREEEKGVGRKDSVVEKVGLGRGGRKKKVGSAGRNREQTKFMVDLGRDSLERKRVLDLLTKVNDKAYGREVTFKDMSIFALDKLTMKDLEKIQEGSLSEMEKVQRALNDYNEKNGAKLTLGAFLLKKLNI